jgi:hypothetical protein
MRCRMALMWQSGPRRSPSRLLRQGHVARRSPLAGAETQAQHGTLGLVQVERRRHMTASVMTETSGSCIVYYGRTHRLFAYSTISHVGIYR